MLGGLAKTELNGSGSGYECGCSSAAFGWPYSLITQFASVGLLVAQIVISWAFTIFI